jgi:hypothetical protein
MESTYKITVFSCGHPRAHHFPPPGVTMSTKAMAKAFACRETIYSENSCEVCFMRKTQAEVLLPYLPQEEDLVRKSHSEYGCSSTSLNNIVPGAQVSSRPVSLPAPRRHGFFSKGNVLIKRKSVGNHSTDLAPTLQTTGKNAGSSTTFDEILNLSGLPQTAVLQTIKRVLPESLRIAIISKSKGGDRASLPSQLHVSPTRRVLEGSKPKELHLTTSSAQSEETPTTLQVGRPRGLVTSQVTGRQSSQSLRSQHPTTALGSTSVAKAINFSRPTPQIIKGRRRKFDSQVKNLPDTHQSGNISTSQYNNFNNYTNSSSNTSPRYRTYNPSTPNSIYIAYSPPGQQIYTPYRTAQTFDEILNRIKSPPHPEFNLHITPSTGLPALDLSINRNLLYPHRTVLRRDARQVSPIPTTHLYQAYSQLQPVATASTRFSAPLLSSVPRAVEHGFQMVGYHEGVPTFLPAEEDKSSDLEVWEDVALDSPAKENVAVREYIATSFEGMGVPLYT